MQSIKTFIKESLGVIIVSIIIVVPVRLYIAQPFVVSGDSMDNTFQNNNYLIVDEISYRFENPHRGDVIIFRVPEKALKLSNFALNKKVYFIKRVIGLPGETVEINSDQVKIYNDANPDGIILNEPYAYFDKNSPFGQGMQLKQKLGPNEYWVMGDNRHNSSDSRFWGILKRDNITGRAFVRMFPFNKISAFPGENRNY